MIINRQDNEARWTCPNCLTQNTDLYAGPEATSEPICGHCDAMYLWSELAEYLPEEEATL